MVCLVMSVLTTFINLVVTGDNVIAKELYKLVQMLLRKFMIIFYWIVMVGYFRRFTEEVLNRQMVNIVKETEVFYRN